MIFTVNFSPFLDLFGMFFIAFAFACFNLFGMRGSVLIHPLRVFLLVCMVMCSHSCLELISILEIVLFSALGMFNRIVLLTSLLSLLRDVFLVFFVVSLACFAIFLPLLQGLRPVSDFAILWRQFVIPGSLPCILFGSGVHFLLLFCFPIFGSVPDLIIIPVRMLTLEFYLE